MNKRFQRTELMLGEEAMKKLAAARVAVFGVGGVGGYVVEVIDGAAEEDDAVFQEAGINIIAPFTLRRLFDDNRYIHICQN